MTPVWFAELPIVTDMHQKTRARYLRTG